jgi:hypothetical protein
MGRDITIGGKVARDPLRRAQRYHMYRRQIHCGSR